MEVVQMTKNGMKVLTPREVEYATAKRELGSNLTKWACKIKGQTLNQFYQEVKDKYQFDDLGRFEDYFETGLERVVWTVYDERLKGFNGMFQMNQGDQIVLLDWAGNQIREPVILTENHVPWQEFGEMCHLLKIKPKNVFKSLYMMGIYRK